MAQPVSIKGKEGATVMPMEAIAMAIMNNAMKGDLAAANFIRQLTGTARDPQLDEAKARERLLAVVAELRTALEADGLKPADGSPELELLAVEFSTLRRIAALLMADGHTDIVVTATKPKGDDWVYLKAFWDCITKDKRHMQMYLDGDEMRYRNHVTAKNGKLKSVECYFVERRTLLTEKA